MILFIDAIVPGRKSRAELHRQTKLACQFIQFYVCQLSTVIRKESSGTKTYTHTPGIHNCRYHSIRLLVTNQFPLYKAVEAVHHPEYVLGSKVFDIQGYYLFK